MTKKEVLLYFRAWLLPVVRSQYGRKDKPAVREAWNNYTDELCKRGKITSRQYESWSNPF